MRNTRTIITLSMEEKSWLEKHSRATGISMAETIRKGIARLMEQESPSVYQEVLKSTSGIWKKGDGLKYQDKLRKEWR